MRRSERADSQGVILVDRADDLGSLRAKIESTTAEELFVYIPPEATVLRTPLEFRILGRLLQTIAAEVVIVSSDRERRRLARLAGFRTRASLRGLLHLLPPDQAERFRFRWFRIWQWVPIARVARRLAVWLAGLVLLGTALVLLPEMRITMEPYVDVDSALFEIRVDPTVREPEVGTRRLPGVMLSQRFTVEAQVPASGVGRRPTERARGTVTFVNSRENLVIVPRGVVLTSTNGVRFATDEEVQLPPNTLIGVRVGIHALEPGPAGNVAAMTIIRFLEPGPPGVGVFNERPTEGGSEEEFPEVSERDHAALRAELLRRAQDEGWQILAALAGDEFTIVSDSIRVETEAETLTPNARVPASTVRGQLQARVSALAFNNTAFTELAAAIWAASLPAGFRPLGEPPELTLPEYLGQDAGGALYRVGVRGRITREMDADVLARRLRGATVEEAQAALAARDGQGAPVRVEIWPSWAPRAFRLRVQEGRVE
jgi:hypothetical protein